MIVPPDGMLGIGDKVTALATLFDTDGRGKKKWSKEKFGSQFKTAKVHGLIVCAGVKKDNWLVFWEFDSTYSSHHEKQLTKV